STITPRSSRTDASPEQARASQPRAASPPQSPPPRTAARTAHTRRRYPPPQRCPAHPPTPDRPDPSSPLAAMRTPGSCSPRGQPASLGPACARSRTCTPTSRNPPLVTFTQRAAPCPGVLRQEVQIRTRQALADHPLVAALNLTAPPQLVQDRAAYPVTPASLD